MLEHCGDGCLQAVLDEYAHILIEAEGLQTADVHERARRVTNTIAEALSTRAASNTIDHVVNGGICPDDHRISSHFAARYGRAESNDKVMMREATIRTAFNSPFRPFVLASTSLGQEGLDFHSYCHAVVHWNLPSIPVYLEQREGRVHRYKGHAIRKNVAAEYGQAAVDSNAADPWADVFAAAEAAEPDGGSGIRPYWVFTRPDGATIERYVPAMPLSRASQHYGRLLRTVGAYRSVIGQPRQDDLIRYVGEGASWLGIDLAPPVGR